MEDIAEEIEERNKSIREFVQLAKTKMGEVKEVDPIEECFAQMSKIDKDKSMIQDDEDLSAEVRAQLVATMKRRKNSSPERSGYFRRMPRDHASHKQSPSLISFSATPGSTKSSKSLMGRRF